MQQNGASNYVYVVVCCVRAVAAIASSAARAPATACALSGSGSSVSEHSASLRFAQPSGRTGCSSERPMPASEPCRRPIEVEPVAVHELALSVSLIAVLAELSSSRGVPLGMQCARIGIDAGCVNALEQTGSGTLATTGASAL